MSATTKGFAVRDVSFAKAFGEKGAVVVNPGKVLPATATGNLFAVTGSVLVTGLVGVVTTVFAITAVHISLGISSNLATGQSGAAAIAANPAAAYASTPVGSVITLPPALGGALPAAVSAQEAVAGPALFEVTSANITITTDATNTGAITWFLSYVPLQPKRGASVTYV